MSILEQHDAREDELQLLFVTGKLSDVDPIMFQGAGRFYRNPQDPPTSDPD